MFWYQNVRDGILSKNLLYDTLSPLSSDNFWSAFCVFHAHFWEKTHSFKICALKKRNDFRQLKRSKLILLRMLMHF